jgi:hypothetical protein
VVIPERVKAALRRAPAAIAILVVLAAYAFFPSGGTFTFRRIPWDQSYYGGLSEGFFRGHLYMANEPDPRLMAMPFPYDYKAREGNTEYIWDASYLNGHYYLYFSPLPALSFYMPYRLLRGAYPRDGLAAAVFASWAFLAAVAFARRALALVLGTPASSADGSQASRPALPSGGETPPGQPPGRRRSIGRLHIPFPVWMLMIGFGNVAIFQLADIRIYEVAILAGAAVTATWAYALVRYVEQPTVRRAVWMSVWLALSIAARPNVGVLLFVTAAVILLNSKERRRTFVAAAMPLAVVAAAMITYNVARFGRPFEFGETYQLTFVPMEGRAVCRLCTLPELSRFGNNVQHYLFWPLTIHSDFPFVGVQYANPDPNVSFPMPGSEPMIGVVPLVPLTMLGTLLASLFALRRTRPDNGTRAGMQVIAGAWLILLALSTCWWIVSRYSLDFMFLMTAASVICVESGLTFLDSIGVRLLPLRIAVFVLAVYTILVGFMLGFANGTFKRLHPEMFEKIVNALK